MLNCFGNEYKQTCICKHNTQEQIKDGNLVLTVLWYAWGACELYVHLLHKRLKKTFNNDYWLHHIYVVHSMHELAAIQVQVMDFFFFPLLFNLMAYWYTGSAFHQIPQSYLYYTVYWSKWNYSGLTVFAV